MIWFWICCVCAGLAFIGFCTGLFQAGMVCGIQFMLGGRPLLMPAAATTFGEGMREGMLLAYKIPWARQFWWAIFRLALCVVLIGCAWRLR